jgi:hypothetical protein
MMPRKFRNPKGDRAEEKIGRTRKSSDFDTYVFTAKKTDAMPLVARALPAIRTIQLKASPTLDALSLSWGSRAAGAARVFFCPEIDISPGRI